MVEFRWRTTVFFREKKLKIGNWRLEEDSNNIKNEMSNNDKEPSNSD